MKTKEDILDELTEGRKGLFNDDVQVSFDDSIKAMQEYADQQTEQLKKEVEYFKKLNSGLSLDFQKNQAEINELKKLLSVQKLKQTSLQSQLSEKDKELSELKLTYKDDIKDAYDAGFEHVGDVMMGSEKRTSEQYYTQTHGQ